MKCYFSIFILLQSWSIWSQVGGERAFESLRLSMDPLTVVSSGSIISNTSKSTLAVRSNPAIQHYVDKGAVAFGQEFGYASIGRTGLAATLLPTSKWKLTVGVNATNFGDFDRFDETGTAEGSFQARDLDLYMSTAKKVGPFAIGITASYLSSQIDNYSASGLIADIGGIYELPNKNLNLAMVIKNIGGILSDYTGASSSMPIELQFGFTAEPEHMPVRFNVSYTDALSKIESPEDGEEQRLKVLSDFVSHLNTAIELLISKSFVFNLGYNHQIRRELGLENNNGLTGFGWGFTLNTKKFNFELTRSHDHRAGGTTFISLASNIDYFFNKKI